MKRTPLSRHKRGCPALQAWDVPGACQCAVLRRKTEMRESNPDARKRRRANTAQIRRSPEHRQARQEAVERSGGRCEYVEKTPAYLDKGYGGIVFGREWRCTVTEGLEAHHDSYDPPKIRMLCTRHHHLVESILRPFNVGRLR